MTDAEIINAAIVANAQQPKRMRHGGREVEQHALKDLIDAAGHVAGDASADQPHFGMRFVKLVPPSAG
jgi:hypothetical protein